MPKSVLAVDLGSGSGRVMRGDFDGHKLTISPVHRFENSSVRARGRLFTDLLYLLHQTTQGIACAVAAGAVDGLGLDGWGTDFALLDDDGYPVANPRHYRDPAFVGAAGRFCDLPADWAYRKTGQSSYDTTTLYQWRTLLDEDAELVGKFAKLALLPDALAHLLGGELVAERTNATTTQLTLPGGGDWAGKVLAAAGLPCDRLPPLAAAGAPLGTLHEGFGAGKIPITATATHDTAAALACLPPDCLFVSAGTWFLVGCATPAPLVVAENRGLTNEAGAWGENYLLKNCVGFWPLQECLRQWRREGLCADIAALTDRAAAYADAPTLALDDPALTQPGDMPSRVRARLAELGHTLPEDPAALVACLLGSAAAAVARVVGDIAAATGKIPPKIIVLGGGARNALLCRMIAKATHLPVECGPVEASVAGNCLVQLCALGELDRGQVPPIDVID